MKKYRGKYIPFVVKKDSGSFLCLFQKILKSIAENKKKGSFFEIYPDYVWSNNICITKTRYYHI